MSVNHRSSDVLASLGPTGPQRSRPSGEVERLLRAMRKLVRERDLEHADAQAELERLKSRLRRRHEARPADGRAR